MMTSAPSQYILTGKVALMEVPNNNDTKQQLTITCLTQVHIVTCLCTQTKTQNNN